MIYAENILLCIAIPLLVSLLFVRGLTRKFIGSFLLGMIVCLLSAYISGYLNVVTGVGEESTAIFISPIVAETMKLLPILFFLFVLVLPDRSLTSIAVAVGAGFATFENCCYILSSGADNMFYVIIRGLAVGVMHIVSTFALAFWLVVARRLRALTFPAVVGALSISMIFHALYNLLVSGGTVAASIGYALPLVTAAGLAVLYRRISVPRSKKREK